MLKYGQYEQYEKLIEQQIKFCSLSLEAKNMSHHVVGVS